MLAGLFGATASAAKIDYRVELELLHSNNINLSENDPIQESVLIPRLAFSVKEDGSAVKLEARGKLERRNYLDNSFSDEDRSEFAGQLNWALIPQRMNLVFEDYLSQQPITLGEGSSPGNLQRVNIFLGGPTFFARLGDATRFQLDLRAADSNAEVTRGFNGKRYSAAAALQRDLTRTSQVSLNLVATKAEFDDPVAATDYRGQEGFVRYTRRLPHGQMEFDLGQSRIDRKPAGNESTTIARALVQWQATPRSRIRVRVRHQFADALQALIVRPDEPGEMVLPELAETSTFVNAGVYRQRRIDADYQFKSGRLGFIVRPLYQQLRYLDNTNGDRKEHGASFEVNYRVQPRVSMFLQGYSRKRQYLNQPRNDLDRVYGVGCEYKLSRHWSWRAEATHNARDSNVANASYKENAVLFTVAWNR